MFMTNSKNFGGDESRKRLSECLHVCMYGLGRWGKFWGIAETLWGHMGYPSWETDRDGVLYGQDRT